MNKIKEKYHNTIKLSQEIDKCQQILQDKPDSIDVLNKLAKIYEDCQDLDQANDYYNRILKLTPENPNLNLKIASLKVKQKKFADAVINYQTALKIQPNQPAWVFIGLGDALDNTKRTEEAIVSFRKAIELKPNYGLIYAKLANALAKKDDDRQTINAYQKAFEIQPELPIWAYINFAKILNKNNLSQQAISICQQALALQPNNFNIHALLAEAQSKNGNVISAIYSYQKAIKLNSQSSSLLHQQLGDLLTRTGNFHVAIIEYLLSIKINQTFFSSYAYLDEALCNTYGKDFNNIYQYILPLFDLNLSAEKAKISALQNYFQLGFLGKQGATIDPLGYYFINQNLRIVYCGIPKNACTLFKNLIVEHSNHQEEYEQSQQNIHQFLASRRGDLFNLISCLKSRDYFKLVILRNPFARLASGYLDKFAKHLYPESFTRDVIRNVQQFLNIEINIEKSITFAQFVEYLARTKDRDLNDHWRPQNTFTGSIEFDLVGQFENLDLVIDNLEKKYNIAVKKKVSNHITRYKEHSNNLPFWSMYPEQLRCLDGMPKANQLYTPELEAIVRNRYAEDIKLYEKHFGSIPS